MNKKEKNSHPILDRIQEIKKSYVTENDWLEAPTTRKEFWEYWWNKARVCENCILAENRMLVVKPDGLIDNDPIKEPKILIVGEGPGAMEDSTGIPMVGPNELRSSRCGFCTKNEKCYSHKLLANPGARHPKNKVIVCNPELKNDLQLRRRFFLQSAGSIVDGILISNWNFAYPRQNWINLNNKLHPEDKWTHKSPWMITNLILCRSFDKLTNKDVEPGSISRGECKRWLAWQYSCLQPKLTIAIGKVALDALVGTDTHSQYYQNNIIETKKFGAVLYTTHPTAIMRETNASVKGLGLAKIAETFKLALDYCGYKT